MARSSFWFYRAWRLEFNDTVTKQVSVGPGVIDLPGMTVARIIGACYFIVNNTGLFAHAATLTCGFSVGPFLQDPQDPNALPDSWMYHATMLAAADGRSTAEQGSTIGVDRRDFDVHGQRTGYAPASLRMIWRATAPLAPEIDSMVFLGTARILVLNPS